MKRITVVIILLLGVSSLNAQDAAFIINAARNRVQSETVYSRSRMVTTAKNGSTRELTIDQFSKDGPHGARTVIVFLSPKSVERTRFLTMNNASGGSDQWIFLPDLNKLRRIATSQSGGSFMGTAFSYDDISVLDRDVSLDTHTLLPEETLNGSLCYVIQSVPKDCSHLYSRTITWIDRENNLIYKAEMYDRRGDLAKVMEMSGFKDIQGRNTPMQTKITAVKDGTSTTIFMENMKYDAPIREGFFTTAFLETGRAQ